jgi:hypothetical protein
VTVTVTAGTNTLLTRVLVQFSVGAFFPLRMSALALSPKATIFALRVRLFQTRTVTSPITSQSTTTTQNLVVLQHGEVPLPRHNHPGKESSAVWRGKEAYPQTLLPGLLLFPGESGVRRPTSDV